MASRNASQGPQEKQLAWSQAQAQQQAQLRNSLAFYEEFLSIIFNFKLTNGFAISNFLPLVVFNHLRSVETLDVGKGRMKI